MAASASVKLIRPWRIWLAITVMTSTIFAASAYSLRQIAVQENARLARLQLDTLVRSRLADLDRGDLRAIADGLGAAGNALYIQVVDGNAEFAVGERVSGSQCAVLEEPMTRPAADGSPRRLRLELCRQFESPLPAVALVGSLFLGVSLLLMGYMHRLERSATRSLLNLFASAGVDASATKGLPGLLIRVGELREALLEAQRREVDAAKAKMLGEIAEQLAHDIRSPLSTLRTLAKQANSSLPQALGSALNASIERVQSVAETLLAKRRDGNYMEPLTVVDVAKLAEAIIVEKRAEWSKRGGLNVNFVNIGGASFVLARAAALAAALSNLLNNALEACFTLRQSGTVELKAGARADHVILQIQDDGPGIAKDLLLQLGQRGVTKGKAGGHGLGIYQAKTAVEAVGGSFAVTSQVGEGTRIEIRLPKHEVDSCVLVDDDVFVREEWASACKKGAIHLRAYADGPSLLADLANLPANTTFFLDSQLGGDLLGEDLAKKLGEAGFHRLFMATSHDAERFSGRSYVRGVVGKEAPAWLFWSSATDKQPQDP